MKKILILILLFFNLIPIFKNGEIRLINTNEILAQSMGEEEADIRYPNGFHLVLWEDGNYTHYWEDVAGGEQGGSGSGSGSGQSFDLPPDEFDHLEELGPPEELIDPDDGYWHIFSYSHEEFLYEWDPLDHQWQIVVNTNNNTSSPRSKYYITLNSETHRYYDGDKIYLQKQTNPITLTIHNQAGLGNINDFAWIRKGNIDTTKCISSVSCSNIMVNTSGTTTIRVDSAGAKTLIKNPLIVSDKPTIIFQREFFYTGRYGFDDSSHKHYDLRANPRFSRGMEVRKINNDTAYVVPWMSIISNSGANTIRIKKINLDSSLASDPNFWVEFRTPNSIQIQGISGHLTYSQLAAIDELNIGASEWSTNIDSLKKAGAYESLIRSIYVVMNTGDTIGKLNISCSHPETKKVVFVYVNTGTGYNNSPWLQKITLLNYLNNNAHRQFFRKWELNTSYIDTMNITTEYSSDPSRFSYAQGDSINYHFVNYYRAKTGIDIDSLNAASPGDDTNKVHFYFITKFPLADTTYSGTTMTINSDDGITWTGNYVGTLFSSASLKVAAHEFGHILNLEHTFFDTGSLPTSPYHIPKYSTTNFMDYVLPSSISQLDMFYYSQWIDVF